MNNKIILIIFFFLAAIAAQIISGKVINHNNEILSGANIYWINSSVGVTTDTNGEFKITTEYIIPKKN